MRPIALLSALFLLALTACAAPPPEESSEPEPSPALSLDLETLERTMSEDRYAALTGFLPVLEEGPPSPWPGGEAEAPEDTTVAGYLDFFRQSWDGEGEAPLAVDYVMAEDLTGDGALELILHFPDFGGNFLILHREGDAFHGLSLGERSFLDLQASGVFGGSGGAAVHSYSRLTFRDGALAVEELGSQVDGVCTIAGETVSQAEFDQWLAEQEGSVPRYTGALWTSY